MTPDASERRDHIFLGGCALAVVMSIGGVFYVAVKQDDILAQVSRPDAHATRTLWADWVCRDGETVHVEATSELKEPRDIFFDRFDADVAAREKQHPRR